MAGPHAGNRNRPAYSGQARFRFPKQIIELFAPRKPIEFKPPPRRRNLRPMMGISSYIAHFETTKQAKEKAEKSGSKEAAGSGEQGKNSTTSFEAPARRRRRVRNEKVRRVAAIVQKGRNSWDPRKDEAKKTKDAYNTLFVTNLPYEIVEKRVHHEFERFGPVVSVVIPKDRSGMPRGYAFVEFEKESDLKAAFRDANGMRIDGRRVLVDVERGRTVKDWYPNRLDGPYNACVRKKRVDKGAERTSRP